MVDRPKFPLCIFLRKLSNETDIYKFFGSFNFFHTTKQSIFLCFFVFGPIPPHPFIRIGSDRPSGHTATHRGATCCTSRVLSRLLLREELL
jgi:hypothetical protein